MKPKVPDIAAAVRRHRREAGLSREALSEISGTGKTAVYDLEHGKKTIRLDTVLKILGALNISLELRSPLITESERSDAKRES
jgi:transcriptional regulator with XRE-family HTH domain